MPTYQREEVEQAMITAISQLPETPRQTLTWDRGAEMSNHANIAAATDLDVFFRDPWQRGTNENTNGLLRQYFPKGTNLSVHNRAHLDLARTVRARQVQQHREPGCPLDQGADRRPAVLPTTRSPTQ